MADPFDVLNRPATPVVPRAEFAGTLRRRLEDALRPTPPAASQSERSLMPTATTAPTPTHATMTPRLTVRRASEALAFYAEAFGAIETMRLLQDDGRIGHAELSIGGARVHLADEFPELGVVGPESLGGSSVNLSLELEGVDVDAYFDHAVALGATAVRPVADQFYGNRAGQLLDPFGHRWTVATVIERLSDEEILRRFPAGGGSEAAEAAQVDLGQRAPAPPPTPTAEPGDGDLGYLTLGVPDLQRAKAFYGALLGWRFEEDSTFEGRTSSHVGNVLPPLGMIGGEGTPRSTLYFRVGDITGAVARIRELGGQAGEPVLHPSGSNASCADDQGLTFDLWQPADGY